jgi:hypothetical protein
MIKKQEYNSFKEYIDSTYEPDILCKDTIVDPFFDSDNDPFR